ncbi:hypothetical protein MKX03_022180 [Papaver bracteatum]|nr:hypothetical protein MKX03_022180 [Papaver bracteatum]
MVESKFVGKEIENSQYNKKTHISGPTQKCTPSVRCWIERKGPYSRIWASKERSFHYPALSMNPLEERKAAQQISKMNELQACQLIHQKMPLGET